jgi:hypothetical protein
VVSRDGSEVVRGKGSRAPEVVRSERNMAMANAAATMPMVHAEWGARGGSPAGHHALGITAGEWLGDDRHAAARGRKCPNRGRGPSPQVPGRREPSRAGSSGPAFGLSAASSSTTTGPVLLVAKRRGNDRRADSEGAGRPT